MNTHVVLPAQVRQCDRVDVLVEDESKGDCEVEDREALGTDGVGKNFNGVGDDEGSESNTNGEMKSVSRQIINAKVTHS